MQLLLTYTASAALVSISAVGKCNRETDRIKNCSICTGKQCIQDLRRWWKTLGLKWTLTVTWPKPWTWKTHTPQPRGEDGLLKLLPNMWNLAHSEFHLCNMILLTRSTIEAACIAYSAIQVVFFTHLLTLPTDAKLHYIPCWGQRPSRRSCRQIQRKGEPSMQQRSVRCTSWNQSVCDNTQTSNNK